MQYAFQGSYLHVSIGIIAQARLIKIIVIIIVIIINRMRGTYTIKKHNVQIESVKKYIK